MNHLRRLQVRLLLAGLLVAFGMTAVAGTSVALETGQGAVLFQAATPGADDAAQAGEDNAAAAEEEVAVSEVPNTGSGGGSESNTGLILAISAVVAVVLALGAYGMRTAVRHR